MSKQTGQKFIISYIGLRDVSGIKVDAACHLHVYVDNVQTEVLVRDDGAAENPIVYIEGAADEDNEYRATVVFDAPVLAGFRFHFPGIEHADAIATVPIHGPVLTEPTT